MPRAKPRATQTPYKIMVNRMTASKEKVLDDIARFAGGAVSMMSGLSQSIREEIKSRVDEMAHKMDLVPREDFDRLEALVQAQAAKIDALENAFKPKKPKTTKKKTS